ncbi:MAG: hypothetical protein ACI8VC_002954, partial [Candidatus Endobugula sp.]
FVVETNVHFPTDISLLFDAARKVVQLTASLSEDLGLTSWRQSCCGQVFSYIMTGAFMLLQPQRDLNIDCNYVLYDNGNVEYIS